MAWKSSFRQNYRTTFSPTVPTSAVADVEAHGGEKWEHLKSGGKQWQATPKNLPRMQPTRAIPVAWLNSGLCPDRPKSWIPIIIIIILLYFNIVLWEHRHICSLSWTETSLCGAWPYYNFFISVTVTSFFFLNIFTFSWIWICLWCHYCNGVGINNQNTIWRWLRNYRHFWL